MPKRDRRSKIKVAALLSFMNQRNMETECRLVQLPLDNWQNVLPKERPDLVLIESIGGGNYYKLLRQTRDKDAGKENIFTWCKEHGIPTAFWNKEDPVSFKVFLDIAKYFDYIFTTDSDCVPKYKKACGHSNVFLLPFAAQIKLHNPIDRDKEKIGKIAFAGTWYANRRPQRQKDMEILFDPSLPYGLDIYDRNYNLSSNKYRFPDKYQPYVKGVLPYEQMAAAIKKYDVFLNVNTARNSPTMMSRRVYDVLASGTNLISSYSRSVEEVFPGIVLVARTAVDTEKHLARLLGDKDLRDRLSLLGQREIISRHTYSHRMETILTKTGLLTPESETDGVSILAFPNRPTDINGIVNNFSRQRYPVKELIIIAGNERMNLKSWKSKLKKRKDIRLLQLNSPAAALPLAVNLAQYNFISVFATSDYYAPHFIGDLMNVFQYADAGIVGKNTFYAFAKSDHSLRLCRPDAEYRYTDALLSAAFIFRKELTDKIRLAPDPTGRWLLTSVDTSLRIYSADRFNYAAVSAVPAATGPIVAGKDDYLTKITV